MKKKKEKRKRKVGRHQGSISHEIEIGMKFPLTLS
jgi:hypothetical protein